MLCICNDRQHPKVRSLSNYCYDLKFAKPSVMQIRGAMLSICCKEGVSIRPEALDEIIIGANQDVRQVLHHLSLLSSKEKTMSTEQAKIDAQRSKKDFKLGPWDVCRKVSCNSQFIYSVLIGETFILPISSELDLDRSSK